MRKQLKPLVDQKVHAVGTIHRYGLKPEYIGGASITALLNNLTIEHEEITVQLDHAWVKCGKTFAKANIHTGSTIKFNCHVKKYTRGHVSQHQLIDKSKLDIGINRASRIQIVEAAEGETFLQFLERMKSDRFITNKYDHISESVEAYLNFPLML